MMHYEDKFSIAYYMKWQNIFSNNIQIQFYYIRKITGHNTMPTIWVVNKTFQPPAPSGRRSKCEGKYQHNLFENGQLSLASWIQEAEEVNLRVVLVLLCTVALIDYFCLYSAQSGMDDTCDLAHYIFFIRLKNV